MCSRPPLGHITQLIGGQGGCEGNEVFLTTATERWGATISKSVSRGT